MSPRLDKLGALVAVVLWGISFVATKAVLREISPVCLVFVRFGIGSAFLVATLAARGEPVVPPRETWRSLALLGFVGVFVHQLLQAYGLSRTSATSAGWLIGLIPIWSAVLAASFLGERLGAGRIVGLAVAFVGAAIVVSRGRGVVEVARLPSTTGDLLILASTLNWAVYTILGRRALRTVGPHRVTAGAMFLGWLMLLPLFVTEAAWRDVPSLTARGWSGVVFLGVGCSGLGYLLWYGALARIETTEVAALLYLEPLVTLVAAAWLLGEPVGPATVAGGLLVLAGVFLVQRSGTEKGVRHLFRTGRSGKGA